METALQGRKFEELEHLLEGIYDLLNEVQLSELIFVFYHWIECVRWVIDHYGNYYHK
jgi:hypothetical protein